MFHSYRGNAAVCRKPIQSAALSFIEAVSFQSCADNHPSGDDVYGRITRVARTGGPPTLIPLSILLRTRLS